MFIAREQSYHGTTFGALSLGSYWARRKPFEDVLMNVPRIPACNPYRSKDSNETDQQYVARLRADLEKTFQDVGPGKIAGFICEPVVGAVSVETQALLLSRLDFASYASAWRGLEMHALLHETASQA